MSNHEDLEAWKQSIELVDQVYELCKVLPVDERFGLVLQMQRCAVSIPANLAEGCSRDSTKDFLKFVSIARGSLAELSTFIVIVKRRDFVSPDKFESIDELIQRCGRLIGGLRRSLRNKLSK
jgi:four helix bundle protein